MKAVGILVCTVVIASLMPVAPVFAQAAPPATLVYNNRPIVEFRATLLARTPAERAAAARSQIDAIVASRSSGPARAQLVEGVMVVAAASQNLFVIAQGDLDELRGETIEQKAAMAVARLQTVLDEELELRTPARLAIAVAQTLVATILFGLLLTLLWRGDRVFAERLPANVENKLERISAGDRQLVKASGAADILRRLIHLAAFILSVVLSYFWLTFVLRRFPYTRPWGESLRDFLLTRLGAIGLGIIESIPGLFTVAVIVLITRFVAKFLDAFFEAVEKERLQLPLIYPETAPPTRRIVKALVWLFALAVSYPYLPGSDSEAFKGISVFVGLIVSLGSTGVVGQVMSGLTITYSRALRLGDFVKIGDVEGTVTHLGSLSTKIKTDRREDVTIPNAVVVSTPVTNYSRFAETAESVSVPATITVGYDVPWRQINAMLMLAAERTPGVRRSPPPVVRQSELETSHVRYTLLVCLEEPQRRVATLGVLRGNILDVFNEFGVQIMTPNYEGDPDSPKIVPRDRWSPAPAQPQRTQNVETAVP